MCSFAQSSWKLAKVDCFSNLNSSFDDTMMEVFQPKSSKELEIICSIAWQLWAHRNSVVWKKRFQPPSVVVNKAGSFIFQWKIVVLLLKTYGPIQFI